MIFVTVGTELPFDRLVRAVDDWARETGRTDVFAQIGHTSWRPSFIRAVEFLEPAEFNRCFTQASAIIAHAGMGTILSALRFEKPILVMPRRAGLGEQRNDHQLATARQLLALGKINVAFDERDLHERLQTLETLPVRAHTGTFASSSLIAAVRGFIARGEIEAERAASRPPTDAAPANTAIGRPA
jgi:UDP-N-acetylglucosamine transferase subunit ALG13